MAARKKPLKPQPQDKYTPEKVATALQADDVRGAVTLCARKLGCAPNTVRRYLDKYPYLKDIQQAEFDKLGDDLENAAHTRALGGSDTLLIFLLKTKYRERGYSERHEVTGANGGAMELNFRIVNDFVGGHDDSGE